MSNSLADNLLIVQQNIQQCAEKSGRDVNDIHLIAVSKTRYLDEVKAVASLGQKHFGENRCANYRDRSGHVYSFGA